MRLDVVRRDLHDAQNAVDDEADDLVAEVDDDDARVRRRLAAAADDAACARTSTSVTIVPRREMIPTTEASAFGMRVTARGVTISTMLLDVDRVLLAGDDEGEELELVLRGLVGLRRLRSSRRLPASALNFSSLDVRSAGVVAGSSWRRPRRRLGGVDGVGSDAGPAARTPPAPAGGTPALPRFFAFFRILTRSTMRGLHAVLACGRGSTRGGSIVSASSPNASSSAVVARVLIRRGMPPLSAWISSMASRLNGLRVPPATRMRCSMYSMVSSSDKRTERVAHPDALPQRRVGLALEARLQLRLADQDDAEQVLIVELEVRQQADLVERRLRRDQLRLVDDQHRLALLLVQLVQLRVDLIEQVVAEPRRLELRGRGRSSGGAASA